MSVLSELEPAAYLAGCLLGDAWITAPQKNSMHGVLCMRVADREFAEAFATAIGLGFRVDAKVVIDERGFFLVRKNNGYNRFGELRGYEPSTDVQRAAWLRGFFDSEGNVICSRKPSAGPKSWDRRIAMFSTNHLTLDRSMVMLEALGIQSRKVPWHCGEGHIGDKPVFAVVLSCGQENMGRFASVVGSSIHRHQSVLDLIPTTYHPDIKQSCRDAQAAGAATKRKAVFEVKIPFVVLELKKRIEGGLPITQAACNCIKWHGTVLHFVKHSELLKMARGLQH